MKNDESKKQDNELYIKKGIPPLLIICRQLNCFRKRQFDNLSLFALKLYLIIDLLHVFYIEKKQCIYTLVHHLMTIFVLFRAVVSKRYNVVKQYLVFMEFMVVLNAVKIYFKDYQFPNVLRLLNFTCIRLPFWFYTLHIIGKHLKGTEKHIVWFLNILMINMDFYACYRIGKSLSGKP